MKVFTIGFTKKSADRFFGIPERPLGRHRDRPPRIDSPSVREMPPARFAASARGGDSVARIRGKFRIELSTAIPLYGDNIPRVRQPGRSCAVRRREAP